MNIKQLIEKAEAGDMLSQSSLSTMYHEGDGVSQDDEKLFIGLQRQLLKVVHIVNTT